MNVSNRGTLISGNFGDTGGIRLPRSRVALADKDHSGVKFQLADLLNDFEHFSWRVHSVLNSNDVVIDLDM